MGKSWFQLTLWRGTPKELTSYVSTDVSTLDDDVVDVSLSATFCTDIESTTKLATSVSHAEVVEVKIDCETEVVVYVGLDSSLVLREGTTRYIQIACKNKHDKTNFNFDGYTVQTFIKFGKSERYLPTAVVENVVSFKVPADISVGKDSGESETRIFKGDDVFSVIRLGYKVERVDKPDIVPYVE